MAANYKHITLAFFLKKRFNKKKHSENGPVLENSKIFIPKRSAEE